MQNFIKKKVRILVADDHPMMLMGVRALLSTQPNIEIVGEASTGEEAIAMAKTLTPDIVVMDISLPDMNGLDATIILLHELPDVKVIILSMFEDSEYVSMFVNSGASAYVLKNNSPDELLSAVDAVSAGGAFFSSSVSQKILKEQKKNVGNTSTELKSREKQVLILIAKGYSSKQIADKLCLSTRTVAKYRELVMQRLNLHTVADLTKYAIAKKWITIDPV